MRSQDARKLVYDGMGAVTSYRWRDAADTQTIVGFEHAWDPSASLTAGKAGNPKYEARTHQQSGYRDEYTYDVLHRLTRVA